MMGAGNRYYIVEDDDTIRPISAARFDRLTAEGSTERLPEYARRRVRFASIRVDFVERRPVGVREAEFGCLRFDRRGRFDESEWIAVLMAGIDKYLARFEPPGDAREQRRQAARSRIKRAHDWKPSRSLRSRLYAAALGMSRQT